MYIDEDYLRSKLRTDLSAMHRDAKVVESSFEPVFDFRMNRFESVLHDQ